ncbi:MULTISPECIES: glycoside hydrolase family 36 protein [unclassified Rathayibacter]|uniref:glycoside hydrolase family 36 protein n=1 Tax=unclassified Rathayibacter TaxID=2609250 RepID=UPI000F4BED84|nr:MULTISPECIES: alpha-galactosidase [unclassified Rathayibacter]ROP49148.1 alpha-galactosidase [Rathayibacter sp. PhB186]ROS50735.1 alpha-galactosidase [Rathayibacter sp. PhB185]
MTTTDLAITVGGVHFTLRYGPEQPVWLTSATPSGTEPPLAAQLDARSEPVLVELSLGGESHVRHSHNARHRNYAASRRLRYVSHKTEPDGRALAITQHDARSGATVTTSIVATAPDAVQLRNRVVNEGKGEIVVEYLSTLILGGFSAVIDGPVLDELMVHTARNTWTAEYRWSARSLAELGFVDGGIGPSTSNVRASESIGAIGAWSTGSHLPVAVVTAPARGIAWAWQLEHNGAWHTEFSDIGIDLAVSVSGPTFRQHHWRTRVSPGDGFETVTVGLAVVVGSFDDAIGALTQHRRAIVRPHPDRDAAPVILNDYMNALMGDPTTEKLLPLIDAAARIGAECFVIDAGWYSDDAGWWTTVGVWEESTQRFPGGLTVVLDRIRDRGMTPGLWLEPEVIGVESPALTELPPEAYFTREGRPVAEHGRYHLDYRHPAVVDRMNGVVDRLVADYGVGYLKLDHNINIGEGTEIEAASLGEGLLGHNRAYLAWLAGVLDRHPALVLENCSSGGMRVDYGQLSVSQLQSTSDQENPLSNVAIAAAAPSAVLPEQAAVWSYPQPEHSDAMIDLTMAQSVLQRVHLSGRIDLLSAPQIARVAEWIGVHKSLRPFVRDALPFWPLGLPAWEDEWVALGLHSASRSWLTVWRRPVPGRFAEGAFPAALGGWALTETSTGDSVLLPGVPADAWIRLPHDSGATLLDVPGGARLTMPSLPGTVLLEWTTDGSPEAAE